MSILGEIKISIIVPVFNTAEYLIKCLDSIVSQSLKDIEIIIINDGSTDNSEEICQRYLEDERVSYFYKKNEGLAAARQDGMNIARGEYIGFIDSDDWIDINMYEVMYSTAKKYDVDVVYINRMDGENGPKQRPEIKSGLYNREQIVSEILPKTLAYIGKNGNKVSISPNNCRRIYKKSLIEDNQIEFDRRFRRSQDMMLTYECMLYAKSFYYLGDDYLYHTRIVGDSLSRGYTKNMWNLYIPLIERLYKDTAIFPELQLMDSMHLRAFYYVTDCIENEMKPTCPNSMETRINNIQIIMNHPICNKYYGHIQIEKLNPLYQHYYKLIHKKNAKGVFSVTKRYKHREKRKQKILNPAINFFSENKVTGTVYKKIRNKERH